MKDGISSLTIQIPSSIRERARKVAKRLHTSTTHLVCMALEEKFEAVEKKWRDSEALIREEKRAELEARKERRQLRRMGDAPVSQLTPVSAPTTTEDEPPEQKDTALDKIYEHHAKRIFEVLSSPVEKRLRVGEALSAVRRERPLTYPSDKEVLTTIEQIIIQLRTKTPPPPTVKEDIGRTINPNQIPTFGDTDDNE